MSLCLLTLIVVALGASEEAWHRMGKRERVQFLRLATWAWYCLLAMLGTFVAGTAVEALWNLVR